MFKWSRATRGAMNGENGFMRAARVPYRVLYALLFTLVVVIIVLLLPSDLRSPGPGPTILVEEDLTWYTYNTTYPLSSPIRELHCRSVIDEHPAGYRCMYTLPC